MVDSQYIDSSDAWTTACTLGRAKEKSCPAAAWQGFFRTCAKEPKGQAVVKGQEAGEQTEVRGSA